MTRTNARPAVVALLMLTALLGGCALEEKNPTSIGQAAQPFEGEAEAT